MGWKREIDIGQLRRLTSQGLVLMGYGKKWSQVWHLDLWLEWLGTIHQDWGHQRRNRASYEVLFCPHLLFLSLKCVVPWGSLFDLHCFSFDTLDHNSFKPWTAHSRSQRHISVYHFSLETYSTSIFQLIHSNLLSTYALRGEMEKSPEFSLSLSPPSPAHEISHQPLVPQSSSR